MVGLTVVVIPAGVRLVTSLRGYRGSMVFVPAVLLLTIVLLAARGR